MLISFMPFIFKILEFKVNLLKIFIFDKKESVLGIFLFFISV